MRWQFIRFYIGLIVVLLLAATAFYISEQRRFEERRDERLEGYMSHYVGRIREKLTDSPTDIESRTRVLEEILATSRSGERRENPTPGRVVERGAINLSDEDWARLDEGAAVVVRTGNERQVYAGLEGGQVIDIGPIIFERDSYSRGRDSRGRDSRGRDSGGMDPRQVDLLVLLALPFAVILIFGAVTFLLIRPIERRISALTEVTRRFGEGNLASRVEVGRKGSLDELEASFNAMAIRTEDMVNSQRDLLRAVSHDLRTPLARLFFALDDAQTAGEPGEKDRHLMRIDRSLVELNDLVEEVLTFLRLDDTAAGPEREAVDVTFLLQDAADLASDLRKDIKIKVACGEGSVFAEPRYLKRAVSNLVTNAVRHAQERVWISCQEESGSLKLIVEDDGPGIPEEEQEKIFEPFYRPDRSRSSDQGGSGLGLAIVDRIMAWHQGSVAVTRSQYGGACFTLTFPHEHAKG